MKIRDFGVEIWMNRYENHCELNLAETCVERILEHAVQARPAKIAVNEQDIAADCGKLFRQFVGAGRLGLARLRAGDQQRLRRPIRARKLQ